MTNKQSTSTIWLRIKDFMKRSDAAEWTMSVLTLVIIILTAFMTYFNWRQISIFKNSAVAELRAYIVLNPTVRFMFTGIDSVSTAFTIKNVGKTPAYNVSICARVIPGQNISHHDVDSTKSTGFIIGSDQETAEQNAVLDRRLTKNELADIRSHRIKLFFAGKVTYEDIFKNRRRFYFGTYYDPIHSRPIAEIDFFDAN